MKPPLEDTDLISARKAAIAWSEEANHSKMVELITFRNMQREISHRPIFFLAGVLTGLLGCLIAASLL